MSNYNIIVSTDESTLVTEYTSQKKRSGAYQSEASLEKEFIEILSSQGYQYAKDINSSEEMISNLRFQLEKLNNIKFSNNEWKNFYKDCIANKNEGIVQKSRKIQEDFVQILKRDDGSSKNILLIDKKDIHNNFLQVINQYSTDDGKYKNRYDVTILINGIPIVHVELKRRGVALKEAFNQIERYQRDSFWAGDGLYEYIQIFVISNGTNTKYYSNTTRESAIKDREKANKKNKTSNSFEFTSFWADSKNKIIPDLVDFARTFFAKHTLLNILTKYCVFTSENKLVVMRPYQIMATEEILKRIQISKNYKKMGTIKAGGYIWHTTGSGKTLTSFKTSQLSSRLEYIDKVLFVVDRKDLDYQTIEAYERYEKGSANGSKNTKTLQRQLENKDENGNFHEYKIIITTIQKLDRFISKNENHPIYNKNIVMIFDECHRNQFGNMHRAITKKFKNYFIFGFTGTPIFEENSVNGKFKDLQTTQDVFGDRLHTYTIVNAINDGNVLPFKIDYINTMKIKENISDKKVSAIDYEKALLAPQRISSVTEYILEHFNQKTKRSYGFNGFNSIFAVSSIEAAKKYYLEFKKQMEEDPSKKLKISLIYSYGVNEESNAEFMDDENSDDTDGLSDSSRDFLEMAIKDYNKEFGTSYDTSSEKFPNFYKDVSRKMKNRKLDLLIVVNMFLTGFDATTLNTLWVDKNLRAHGLIQAFSRTNRILDSVKKFGNIVCFRDLIKETDDALIIFGNDSERNSIRETVILKTYEDYYYGYEDENGNYHRGYGEMIEELVNNFSDQIIGENAEKEFIYLFGEILKLRNILSSFDDFEGNEILTEIEFQDFTGKYNDLYEKVRNVENNDKENINDDIIFEMELVKQIEVNIDYILNLLIKYHESNNKDEEIFVAIDKAVKSSPDLRNKKDLIDKFMLKSKKKLITDFINKVNVEDEVINDWKEFVSEEMEKDIKRLINEQRLNEDLFRKYIKNMFRDAEVKSIGTEINEIMKPVSRFGDKNESRYYKKQQLVEEIREFFNKYSGIIHKEDIEKNIKEVILT
ncbi:HsdR family type I site-specific deoxyribonuclease [Candidatus Arthromitus sp. SFB-mouse-Japan]|uniref:type I restriction endonuclease subunit R n=1 Tax=Candidatus Arthromitus sp. SFB-mouse TaxID=49118 RepID=UPI00021B7CF5|nr:type I restriction endonuclease subunit R [Candidatus Arthromitus sp. SFB-mouse]EGX28753.1 type I restriction enzyme, R subunit [Candidatus Arthromitus sp. SFB-mouse-NYU]BAK56570.1 HsdR family type I site-specific deoxyribonuclease [Candidatus Arthromitus sp. SFB-mouse-Japan]BAK79886.1 type I site-specific deoxyribonuclease, HsdR family [Candidatus Arthromitus sp. SFB-mouse-Yit]